MRIAIAGFNLEAVTFLPDPTTRSDFERQTLRGPALVSGLKGTASVGGGFLRACEEADAVPIGIVYTNGGATGSATTDAFDSYLAEIADAILSSQPDLDGVLLHLHGALATTDGRTELDFVRSLRAKVGDDLPIVAALDLHGNLDPELANHVTALVGYRESPHIDMVETGERAGRILFGYLRGAVRPVMAMRKIPLVLPSIFTATRLEPLASIQARARQIEQEASCFVDISVFTGFAYADVPQIGFTVVVVADGDEALAARIADELGTTIWDLRESLYRRDAVWQVDEAVRYLMTDQPASGRPLVLLEHADRGQDSTYVLRALLRRPGKRVAVPYLYDPEAAAEAASMGVGETTSVWAGGKSSAKAGGPVKLEGRVIFAGSKSYVGSGPMRRGRLVDLGLTAIIDCDGIVVWLISHRVSAIDLDPFSQFGFSPDHFDAIVLRSKTHFRAVYEAIASEIVIVDTPDWGTADLTTLPYQRVRPGVFPMTQG